MSNSIYYKRITGSSIQGNGYTVIEPLGTLVVADDGSLRLHDGATAGGNPVGGGTANGWQLTSSSYVVSLNSSTGVLTVPGFMNLTYGQGGADTMNFGTGPGGGSVNATAGNSIYVTTNGGSGEWVFGADGTLTLSSSSNVLYTTTNALIKSISNIQISAGDDVGSNWIFGANGSTTFPNDTILGTGSDPNVYIETFTTSTTSTWTFGTNGVLTLPAATPVIQGNGTGTDVTIIATTGTNTSTWVFGAIGNLTLPNNAGQINTSDNNVDIFATNQRGRVILTGATHAGYDGGRVVINGGNGADNSTNSREGGQIEITGGQGVNGGVGGTINIGTYNASNDENNWLFDTDGSLTLPGAINNSTKTTTGSGDPAYPTAIDLTKTVNKLADNLGSTYTLADGHEGQIMYLVPQTGATMTGVNVTVNHARIIDNSTSTALVVTDALLAPFNCSATPVPTMGVTTLIFTDSAWQADAGVWTY